MNWSDVLDSYSCWRFSKSWPFILIPVGIFFVINLGIYFTSQDDFRRRLPKWQIPVRKNQTFSTPISGACFPVSGDGWVRAAATMYVSLFEGVTIAISDLLLRSIGPSTTQLSLIHRLSCCSFCHSLSGYRMLQHGVRFL